MFLIVYRRACLYDITIHQRWFLESSIPLVLFSGHRRHDSVKEGQCANIPLDLKILEDLALGVVADIPDIDKAAQVEALRSELCHDGGPGC